MADNYGTAGCGSSVHHIFQLAMVFGSWDMVVKALLKVIELGFLQELQAISGLNHKRPLSKIYPSDV